MKRLTTVVIAALFALSFASATGANAKCGDKGGPGYRKANGKCASWKD